MAIAALNLARMPTGEAPSGSRLSSPATGSIIRGTELATSVPANAAPASAASAAPAVTPAPATDAPAGFRVQLGAFADSATAERAWHDLVARHRELAERAPEIATGRTADGRSVERLQVAGFDRAGAEALCRALAAERDPCITVPPLAAAALPR